MTVRKFPAAVVAVSMVAAALPVRTALTQTGQTVGPAPRVLPAPTITSPRFAGMAQGLVALPNGTLLINDIRNHRVMLSDSALRITSVVIDSGEYGAQFASLLSYPGDSVLFVEPVTPSMTLIDPTGKVVRRMAVPNPRDAYWLTPAASNMPGVDGRGRLVHRGVAPQAPMVRIKPNETRTMVTPDTTPVIRDNPVTHNGDTLAWVQGAKRTTVQVARADGRSFSYIREPALSIIDEWAVLSTGVIAIVRGRDYHLELIDADGKVTHSPKIPYPWQALTDDAKAALVLAGNKQRDESMKSQLTGSSGSGSAGGTGAGGGMGNPPLSRADFPLPPPGTLHTRVDELPDYKPVFAGGSVRADAEGNVWVRTQQELGDTSMAVYDVVSSAGTLVDRVVLPKSRTIVGFDKRGNVFLVGRAAGGIQWIERVRWRSP
jgi:hypothetical protein